MNLKNQYIHICFVEIMSIFYLKIIGDFETNRLWNPDITEIRILLRVS